MMRLTSVDLPTLGRPTTARIGADAVVALALPDPVDRAIAVLGTWRAGAAYLAMVSGAPVVPVSFLGTRMPGGSDGSIPPRGSRIAMTFGDPVDLGLLPWPRTREQVDAASARVTTAILQTIQKAQETTGITLPGPIGPKREKKRA